MDNLKQGILNYQIAGIQSRGGKYDVARDGGHIIFQTVRKPSYTRAMKKRILQGEAIDYYSSFDSRPKHFFTKKEWGTMSKENRLLWHLRAMARDDNVIGDIEFEII